MNALARPTEGHVMHAEFAGPIVMLDDIRLWRMLSFWQDIPRPKLDLTSFGHWSGTGLVDYA